MDDLDPDLFDEEVNNHINWKYNSLEFTAKDKVKIFLTGMASLVYPVSLGLPKKYIPLKRRKDLSRGQKINIGLASIWRKEQEFLEDIVSGERSDETVTKDQALDGISYLTEEYNKCKKHFYKR